MRRWLTALCALFLSTCLSTAGQAAEGMWTLDNLPAEAMRAQYGFAPDAAWTQRAMQASVRLAGGCSGSFVSADGLVLTNSHCALGCVSQLSSASEDLVNQGFVSASRSAERRCPDMELNRLDAISDVSAQVLAAGVGKSGKAYNDARDAVTGSLEAECAGGRADRRCDVVELYGGARFHLYRYRRYQDVRLAFAPEYDSGFFGGDPDNFNFPRYNLDMALLRAYEDGKPARVAQYFPMSAQGVQPGEMTLVTGHPGATQRQLTVAQLDFIRNLSGLEALLDLAERRGLLRQYSAQGEEQARIAQRDLVSVENSYKVWYGRLQALSDAGLMDARRHAEAALRAGASAEQGAAWQRIADARRRYAELWVTHALLEDGYGFWSPLFDYARDLVRAAEERAKPNVERLAEYQDAQLPRTRQLVLADKPLYPEYEIAKLGWSLAKLRERLGADDPLVRLVLGSQAPQALAERLVRGTQLGEVAQRRALWDGGEAAIAASGDPMIRLARAVDGAARAIRAQVEDEVLGVEQRAAQDIAAVRFAQTGTGVYPDATFTLRLSYGEVAGWSERGAEVRPFTTLAGLFERATGAPPFRLAPRWQQAQSALALDTPFNFVTTNDIIGGNSGSPVLNRAGEVVGLVFDGNIHSLGGAYGYDGIRNRCVAVDSRAILQALTKVYQADALAAELRPLTP